MKEHNNSELKRNLTGRHIQLMAISGAIGTGLFMGSGKTISAAGPSILLVYTIIGFMLFFVMRAMGEILLSNLQYKSFSDFIADFLGPAAGFFTGWTYWFCWIVTGIADAIAIAGYVAYWYPGYIQIVPAACVLILVALNLFTVRIFGESEFWLSMIKILAIVTLIVVGAIMVFTGYTSTIDGQAYQASFNNIFNQGGVFPKGISGFFIGFQIAVFAFVGIELVGTTAAEAKNPEINLPKAINSIPIRVVIFYVLALLVIISVIPWQFAKPGVSPFVKLFDLAGIAIAAEIINFVVITSALSSANSGVYSTSRMLFSLAKHKNAPDYMTKLSKASVPVNALLFSALFLFIGVLILHIIPDLAEAFETITTVSAILFMFIWSMILISYVKYRTSKPDLHLQSKFKMPGGIFMCYIVLAFFVFVLYTLTLESHTFSALLVTPLWFVALGILYVLRYRNKNNA